MKKIFLSLLALWMAPVLVALPIGNPAEPHLLTRGVINSCPDLMFSYGCGWNIQVGYYGDYVFNRNIKRRGDNHNGISTTNVTTNAGLIALNFFDQFSLFSTLGASSVHLVGTTSAFAPLVVTSPLGLIYYNTSTDFSWSLGERAILFTYEKWLLGEEVQFFYSRLRVNDIRFAGVADGAQGYPDEEARLRYREWQVGLALAYTGYSLCDTLNVIPYVGIKYSELRMNEPQKIIRVSANGRIRLPNFVNARHVGYAVGATLVDDGVWSINFEGRFGDEKAFSITMQFRL